MYSRTHSSEEVSVMEMDEDDVFDFFWIRTRFC